MYLSDVAKIIGVCRFQILIEISGDGAGGEIIPKIQQVFLQHNITYPPSLHPDSSLGAAEEFHNSIIMGECALRSAHIR